MNIRFAGSSGNGWHAVRKRMQFEKRMSTVMTKEFQTPVLVTPRSGETFEIRSATDASTCLLRYWHHECADDAYMAAMKSCLEVRAGLAEPATAREAFIKAAQQAGMLVAACVVL